MDGWMVFLACHRQHSTLESDSIVVITEQHV